MQESSGQTRCMVKAYRNGQMDGGTKGTLKMGSLTDMGCSHGVMGDVMKVNTSTT